MKKYTVGVDFGTLSGRVLVLDAKSGNVLATAVYDYPHGVMDRALPNGTPLPPQFALQHPSDYLEVLRIAVPAAIKDAGISPSEVAGMCIDFTTCTLLPIYRDGTPLCLDPKYSNRPHAYVKLWKHHAAQAEADQINEIARRRGEEWLDDYGGKISSEWALPKILETLKKDPEIYDVAARFMDAGDWLSYILTGEESCAAGFAGFKFLWGADRGFPSDDFFTEVDTRLSGIIGTKLLSEVRTVEKTAGVLSARGATLTGLLPGTPLALPSLDSDVAMPALGIVDPGTLMLIIGTSGVDLIHSTKKLKLPGICGFVRDGVVPGLYTYEAGQCGIGDCFNWFVKNCVPESYETAARQSGISIHKYLRQKAKQLRPGESGLIALDWLNGNRSTLQDSDLSGMVLGITLSTRPEEIYRALIEATAFGLRRIIDVFVNGGLEIRAIRAAGGIAKKDEMLMQIYADVCRMPISAVDTEQGPAHGAAIYAAVAGGLYPSVAEASKALSVKRAITYTPIEGNSRVYDRLYAEYSELYDYFGGENGVMKRLKNSIKE